MPFEYRVNAWHTIKQVKVKMMQIEKDKNEIAGCTFHPNIESLDVKAFNFDKLNEVTTDGRMFNQRQKELNELKQKRICDLKGFLET